MQGLKSKLQWNTVLALLSESIYSVLLNTGKRIAKHLVHLMWYLYQQYRFLRAFKYTKLNIQNHLLEKASAFFGFEWKEEELQNKPKKRSIMKKMKDKIKTSKRLNLKTQPIQSENKPSNLKKNIKNTYRAPS